MTTLCTLFDHNYLDKGLVMYESLEKVCDEFELYVLCMSDKCYEVLTDLNYPHLKPIRLEDFEDEELLRVKPTRGIGEYCWTCSSSLIRYILMTFKPDYCAYIDSDLYFYSDPKVIVEEMKKNNASVQITGHRFCKGQENIADKVGKYCVEYNTFKNDTNGLNLLNLWRNQCLECCSALNDGIHWGDQKYMDNWVEDYDFVIETNNNGAGVAPWNINQYELNTIKGTDVILQYDGQLCKLLFYHFQNIQYIDRNTIRMNAYHGLKKTLPLIRALYQSYLEELDCQHSLLFQKYNINVIIKKHLGYTPIVSKIYWPPYKLFRILFWKQLLHLLLGRFIPNKDIIRLNIK